VSALTYLSLLPSLGWLAALGFAAVWPSLPGVTGRQHAGWLIGFCALRLLATATQAAGLNLPADTWPIAALFAGMSLWEFARRVWNESASRPIPSTTHLLAIECLALVGVVTVVTGTDRPGWFLPVEFVYTLLPGALGLTSTWLLCVRCRRDADSRRRLCTRIAFVALGLFGLTAAPIPGGSFAPPWLAAVALGGACFTLPALRTRMAIGCIAGFLIVALLGPVLVSRSPRASDNEFADLLGRATRAAAPLQRSLTAELGAERISSAARDSLTRLLDNLHASDPLLHAIALWQVRAGELRRLNPTTGDFSDGAPNDPAGISLARPFLVPPTDSNREAGFVTAWVPLITAQLETPTAWLALRYPAIFWETELQHAQRTRLALLGLLAGFCAMGFVLVARQAIENARQLELERTTSASRAKTEFLAFLSHEMRTPLQTILGRAELAGREAPGIAHHTAAIAAQSAQLLRLVTDLLDLGAIEAGRFELRPAPFSLRGLLASLEEIHGPIAAAKGLTLDVVVAPELADRLLGDEARLRQILGNILSNAVKYTQRGEVTLRVARDSSASLASAEERESVAFSITDTGPGLPSEKISQLFTLFTRLDRGTTFTREGTGVGLAIVRRLCDLMGGTVIAANRAGGGAEFVIRLALRVAGASQEVPAAPATINMGRLRVLVAEDNSAAREFLAEALAALGHEVETAADGEAALRAGAARDFDAVMLDINLPGRDGVSVARVLSQQQPRPRLIACSAEAFTTTRDAALAAGMDVFLAKPVNLAALAAALTSDPSPSENIFARLQGAGIAGRTMALLRREWPACRTDAETALEARDFHGLHRFAHRLQSSALLAGDPELLDLCRRLSAAAVANNLSESRAAFDALEQFVAGLAPAS
jgi:signal transduction histidine kinase/DNA-binding response OmpR family regulator